MAKSNRIHVTLSDEQLELVNMFKGELGSTNSEIIRNIVLSWLSEKSFISSRVKLKYFEGDKNEE
ncbi:MAG: CopG family transcriptional regulator [Candidatus Heimdallarchaeota archaeon]|nr:CopG family transcriptional regulator [Candidatus Heimdallarchaeota archaeon]